MNGAGIDLLAVGIMSLKHRMIIPKVRIVGLGGPAQLMGVLGTIGATLLLAATTTAILRCIPT